jgi:hypothetical protein
LPLEIGPTRRSVVHVRFLGDGDAREKAGSCCEV